MGLSIEECKSQYGSQSGRVGSYSTASNTGLLVELWGQHGDWASFKSQKRNTKRDIKSLLSLSLVDMGKHSSSSNVGIPLDITMDARIDYGISNSIDVIEPFIPFTEEIPLYIYLF